MTVAEGFEVRLVASEPMVRQPVAIEFDDRGRLWVIQYLQYPNPAGLKRVDVDRYSRTEYDRVPEPPPHGPRGADRITILEDADGDGRADRAKDFVDGLNLATGLAFGYGGVFVLNVPYLLFYPDRNTDDVPDGDPEVLLAGFGMQDAHSVANSLTWGPDGWLYGCQGSTVTAHIRGIEFQQGVWRYHPRTREFELFCEGGGNSWGLDFDRHGQLLYSTNYGGYIGLHGVQGAYLVKSFGKHGALHNPFAFGYFDHMPHENFQGGHVTVGGTIYQGTAFPERFRGTYFGADLLGHAVYWHTITPDGSTFRTAHGGQLLQANDSWFAPSDLTVGPDGAVYVADWHDARTAHPDPDASWDRSNGRIYRIQAAGVRPNPVPNVQDLSNDELVAGLFDDNEWFARRCRRGLAERPDANVRSRLKMLAVNGSGEKALRALWALAAGDGLDDVTAQELLAHSNPHVRAWTVRLMGDARTVSEESAECLAGLASAETSLIVRSQLACTARRLPAESGLTIARRLTAREDGGGDRYLPLLLWWAVEEHCIDAIGQTSDLFANGSAWSNSLARDVILPRLMKRCAAEATPAALRLCAQLIQSAPTAKQQRRMLQELEQGLALIDRPTTFEVPKGTLFQQFEVPDAGPIKKNPETVQRVERLPDELADIVVKRWSDETTDPTLIRIALRLGHRDAHDRAVQLAVDSEISPDVRMAMLATLKELGRRNCVSHMLQLVDPGEPERIQRATLEVLARFDDGAIPTAVLAAYPRLTEQSRSAARALLFGRRTWAWKFMKRVDAGDFPANEVSVDELRRVALHGDERLDALVRKHWGGIRAGTPGEKLAEMRRLNNELRAGDGDLESGRAAFRKHCAACHRLFGEGNAIGPDLTHANRRDRAFLLASLVDPSAQIRKEYLIYVVQTTDGRVLSGLIVEQTPATVTLLDSKNQRTTIPRNRIKLLKESAVSLMPEDLYRTITAQELRDLFRYLAK